MRQEEILLDLVKQGYEPEGAIKGFPLEIVSQMLYEQVKQGNALDVDVFERSKNSGKPSGGFTHRDSDQGEEFWTAVLGVGDKEIVLRKYYEYNARNIELYCYALDLLTVQNPSLEFKGQISDFPIEVIAMMVAENINQGEYVSYEILEKDIDLGFTWRFSPEGYSFWSKVIMDKDFKIFFTEYPDLENECKQIRNLNVTPKAPKKDISVKDFMKDNKSNLQALERRSKDVFDLTVELLTQLQILEDRQKQVKVEEKAKPKAKSTTKPKAKPKAKKEEPKKKTTTPKPNKIKAQTFELVAISKVVEKDGGDIMNTFYSVEAVDMKVAKSIVTLKWLEEWKTSDFSLVTIMDTTKFQELIKKGEAEGLVQTLDEDVNLDDDDLDFAQGGKIDLQDLDF